MQINNIRNEKGGHNNKHGGNPENHQVILQKPVLHKIGNCKRNGQFSAKIPHTKLNQGQISNLNKT